jgi:hypothetical protein
MYHAPTATRRIMSQLIQHFRIMHVYYQCTTCVQHVYRSADRALQTGKGHANYNQIYAKIQSFIVFFTAVQLTF